MGSLTNEAICARIAVHVDWRGSVNAHPRAMMMVVDDGVDTVSMSEVWSQLPEPAEASTTSHASHDLDTAHLHLPRIWLK